MTIKPNILKATSNKESEKPDFLESSNSQKAISVCVIGKPNAGKSSLLNKIIGHKISIVTPKVQTTRSIITGVVTLNDTQLIIFDTPGIFEPKKKLERAMVRCAWSSLNDADMVLLIIDSTKEVDDATRQIIKRLQSLKIKPVILLNKIDLKSNHIQKIEQDLNEFFTDSIYATDTKSSANPVIFKISALSGLGIDKLLNHITGQAKISPWLYEEDDMTNLPMRFLASEITREQLFLHLNEELPYNLTVQTETWEELKDKSVKINQVIVVAKDNYKTIILGKNGAKIKQIGTNARHEIEKVLGLKAHLFLFVKVREAWESNPEFYHYMGLKIS